MNQWFTRSLKSLVYAGMRPEASDFRRLTKAAEKLYQKLSDKIVTSKKMYRLWKKFRDDQIV